uniref:Bm2743 n=1 Tax=Brugia malayi TaxID=6279 RepID=A0A1I9GE60_BRUMA|nr:Bm2743 [Brugia malayi]
MDADKDKGDQIKRSCDLIDHHSIMADIVLTSKRWPLNSYCHD